MKSGPAPQKFSPVGKKPPEWEVAIAGELGERTGEMIEKLVGVPRGSHGLIYFDSGGGSVYAGLALATLIRLRGLDAVGVVIGECSSAALLPFASCQLRFVTAHSTLFFHPMRWQSEEDVRLEEAAEWARHFKIIESDLDQLLARLFDISADTIKAWTHPGRFLTGQEIVDAGLATCLDLFAKNGGMPGM